MTSNTNYYRGYSLFNDVEDQELQTYNRARVMKNIMLDNSDGRLVNARGMQILAGYFDRIPSRNQDGVYKMLEKLLRQKEV